MNDHTELQLPPLTAIREPKTGGRGFAHPIGRGVGPLGVTGKRGFLVLLVSGVAINAWALFPSAVESGVYVPLPQGPPPVAAESNPVRDAAGDLSVQTSRISFRLMDTGRSTAVSASYGSFNHASAAFAVAMMPLRSKLEALLMLLYSRYGHDASVVGLEMKLQALLRLPDSLLAQLIQHPDLADLATMLDAVFLDSNNLSGIRTELDKIDINSTTGPTEQIDVVSISGRQSYIVYSPAVQPAAENIAVMPTSVVLQQPVQFAVVVQIEAPAEMAAFSIAPSMETFAVETFAVETFAPETFAPVPEQAEPIMADFTTPASAEPVAPAEPSFTSAAASEEPTYSPQPDFEDAVDPDNPFESDEESQDQGEPFSSPGDPGAAPGQDDAPAAEANDTSPADEPSAAAHNDNEGNSSGEPSP
ncbi:hypothetical protein ASE48_31915 [Mycobacterium sp. Root265]|uniref:hypothetical protein n=1 Tax=Mycobacterium sp. Root265 TaxID=1736504 RepID=UPI000709F184|nr:hypothetical protein [Mycobacterium sp. Root265]KRD11895.1 hypothetical protein ASE48_31915 [Mycobacterium sp. Root265]